MIARPHSAGGTRSLALGLVILASVMLHPCTASAHEVRPAYLELKQVNTETYDVLWKVPARGENQRLGLYLRFPEDCRIVTTIHAAIAGGAYLERFRVTRSGGGLTGVAIHVDGLSTTLTDVLARVVRLDGSTQVARLTPDRPSFRVQAAPGGLDVAWTYIKLGIEHILLGVDHLLFVLSLLLLVQGWGRLVKTITAFTVAHSLTLTAATLGFVRIPGPPVEAVIALSIVFVSAEVVRRGRGGSGVADRWPWVVSFTFGLLHGLGFAGALHEIGLPPNAIPLALACFNVGVEFGQLAFVAAVLALVIVAKAARRGTLQLERPLHEVGSALASPRWATTCAYAIGGIAAFWFLERTLGFFS